MTDVLSRWPTPPGGRRPLPPPGGRRAQPHLGMLLLGVARTPSPTGAQPAGQHGEGEQILEGWQTSYPRTCAAPRLGRVIRENVSGSMTTDADLKARVRERMTRTGENYSTARAALLAEPPPPRALVVETDLTADRAVASFFDGDRLRSIPTRRRPRAAVLMHLLRRFERGREYAEREVNAVLGTAHADVASLRRELVDYRWLRRADGIYRVTDEVPERFPNEAQEVPTDEAARLAAVPRRTPRRG